MDADVVRKLARQAGVELTEEESRRLASAASAQEAAVAALRPVDIMETPLWLPVLPAQARRTS